MKGAYFRDFVIHKTGDELELIPLLRGTGVSRTQCATTDKPSRRNVTSEVVSLRRQVLVEFLHVQETVYRRESVDFTR